MSDGRVVDTREIAQSLKGQKPPYECPLCLKEYRSITGIMYHIGQFGAPTKVPRCMLGDDTPLGSPRPSPGSPGVLKRKTPRRDLTWAEAQRLVEVEFDSSYRRIEIDNDLDLSATSDGEECDRSGRGAGIARRSAGIRTPQKRGKVDTSRGKWSTKSKNKSKRKSKLKTPSKDGQGDSVPLPVADCSILENLDFPDAPVRENTYFRFVAQSAEDLDEMVEYDMDEEDYQWLSLVNEDRKSQGLTSVPQDAFEILMDRLEKECFFESQTVGDTTDSSNIYNIDENAVCCICSDGECHNTNAILFCDMCNLAVHQECYGVPYIPEGQWLCRRCLNSPSRGVDCVLCPNKGGAFKQTADGRWAHVLCAIWIPEVQFANPVFLEPIDGIKEIPSARWKLTCYICRMRMGACIQCAKANCYVAFHVTCAQQAGLHMKLDVAKSGEVRKSAFCDSHTPPAVRKKLEKKEREREMEKEKEEAKGKKEEKEEEKEEKEEEEESSLDSGSEKVEEGLEGEGAGKLLGKRMGKGESKGVKRARRMLEKQKGSLQPVVNIPYVPQHRLDRIISRVSLHKKSQFIPKLVSYWKLKRQSRNGVPLLRRLQASNQGQRTSAANLTEEEREVLSEQLSLWKKLRHDLERARLLVELIRKREKLKREQLRMFQQISELQLRPLNVVMKRILDRLGRKDPANIFAEPVSLEEVPDYHDVIKHPMDFSTMRKKVEGNVYTSLTEFERDFYLIWHNATIYNHKDTIYYRAAVRVKEAGYKILGLARQQLASAGVDHHTGLHKPEVQEPPPLTPNTGTQQPADVFENDEVEVRDRLSSVTSVVSLEEQVEFLQEKLEMLQSQCSGNQRKSREKALKKELLSLRRQIQKERRIRGSESDDQMVSPRRQPQHITRNAEELASHVLHGSLRLTPSRQQILSFSGIRLEDRVSAFQEDTQYSDPMASHPDSALRVAGGADPELNVARPSDSNPSEPVSNVAESSESETEQKEPPLERRRPAVAKQKRTRGRPPQRGARMHVSKSDSFVAKIKKKARKFKRRIYGRRRKIKPPARAPRRSPAKLRKSSRPSPRRLPSGTGTSASENDLPVNGITGDRVRVQGPRRTHQFKQMLRTRIGSSSSAYETPAEEFSSEGKFSDSSYFRQRLGSSSGPEAVVPSASSMDDLTVKSPLVLPVGKRGKKRKQSSGSESGTKKRMKRLESKSDSIRRSTVINGLVNGGEKYEIRPLDLVWAKCRGYPPYPALVIDPDIPSSGLNINGEKIQAPSDEVLGLRDINSSSTFLVRFFDGRRTWQWLPPDKIEPLGINLEYDNSKVATSGASKRSVHQAYQRARQYQRRVARKASNASSSSTTGNENSDT